MVRLRQQLPTLELLSARNPHAVVDFLQSEGFDLNDGIVLIENGHIYFGDQAMYRIATLTRGEGLFSTMNQWLFSSERRSRVLYPLLKAGRRWVLKVMRRRPIEHRG